MEMANTMTDNRIKEERIVLEKEVNSHKKEFALEFNRSHGKSHQRSSFNRDNMSPKELKFGDDETKENNMQAQIEPPGTNFLLLSLLLLFLLLLLLLLTIYSCLLCCSSLFEKNNRQFLSSTLLHRHRHRHR
jgi:hypothetical protein